MSLHTDNLPDLVLTNYQFGKKNQQMSDASVLRLTDGVALPLPLFLPVGLKQHDTSVLSLAFGYRYQQR